jgi:uncharacterized membrane protein YhfC
MTDARINALLVVSFAVSALIEIVAPILLGLFIARRLHAKWRYWFYGLLVFLLSQGVTRIPAMLFLQTRPFMKEALAKPLWFWSFLLFAAFTAGLFEEGGRWLAFRFVMAPEERRWRNAVMLGAGHGGLESIGIGLVSIAGLISYLVAMLVPAESLGSAAEGMEAVRKQFQQLAGWEPFLGAWERLGTLCIHIALSVMVLQALRRGAQWWWYALAAHTVVDFTTVGLLRQGTTVLGSTPAMIATEGLVAVYAALAVWLIMALRPAQAQTGQGVTLGEQE